VPELIAHLLRELGAEGDTAARILAPEAIARFQRGVWAGNARELRNAVECCLVFEEAISGPLVPDAAPIHAATWDGSLPYAEARRHALDEFERRYLEDLLSRHGGSVADAAVTANVDKAHLYKILRRHRRTS